jgi:deoxyribonuclease-4
MTSPTPPILGAHVSTAGGTHKAADHARAMRACTAPELAAWRAAFATTDVSALLGHDSYLINLASPEVLLRKKSLAAFTEELQRCEAFGLHYLVSHPGNFIDNEEEGLARNAAGISECLARVPGNTVLCMELTAGQGTVLGSTFEQMAELLSRVDREHQGRLGVCFDTCHVFAAGYDLVNGYDDVMQAFDDTIGLERLRVMHLNDSKHALGTKKDRHELIAEGFLGETPFRRIMTDERLTRVPKVIETPKGDDPKQHDAVDLRMLDLLRSYCDETC